MGSLIGSPSISVPSTAATSTEPDTQTSDDGLLSADRDTAVAAARRQSNARNSTVLTGWRGLMSPRRHPGQRGSLLGE